MSGAEGSRPRRGLIRRVLRLLARVLLLLVGGSVLWVLAYRWVDPPGGLCRMLRVHPDRLRQAIAGDHELSNQVHQAVQECDVDSDGRFRARSSPTRRRARLRSVRRRRSFPSTLAPGS